MIKIAIQNYSEVQREKNKKLKLEGFPFEIEETYPDYINTDKILNAEIELYEVFEPYEIKNAVNSASAYFVSRTDKE